MTNLRIIYDIWYIENCSFIVDLKMIFLTAKEAVVGSEYRTNAMRSTFDEYNPDFVPEEKVYEEKRRNLMSTIV